MRIDPDIDRITWDIALANTPAALQQDWCYGTAMASFGARVMRYGILDGNTLVGLAQFTARRIGGVVQMALCARGPVWLEDVDDKGKAAAYRALKRALGPVWPRVSLVSPDEEVPGGIARMSRVMTGYSTVMLDLTPDLDSLRAGLDRRWRNRLNAAEKSALKVQQNGTKPAQYRWLLETEEGQRKARGYQATPGALVPAYVEAKGDRSSLLILRADEGKAKTAAMLFLTHGCAATYHIGWNDPDRRASGAHNYVLWAGIEMLKARGVRMMDMGGINTVNGAGIARFKMSTGGRVVTLGGTYF